VGTVLALLGIGLGTGGGLWLSSVRNFVQTAERAEGTVIEIVKGRDRDGHTTYWPVIAFTDHQGQRHEFESNIKSSSSSYSVDDKMPILYDRDRPASASIDSWASLYLGPLVLGIFATVFLVLAIVFFVTGLGKAKKRVDVNWEDDEEGQNSTTEPAVP